MFDLSEVYIPSFEHTHDVFLTLNIERFQIRVQSGWVSCIILPSANQFYDVTPYQNDNILFSGLGQTRPFLA